MPSATITTKGQVTIPKAIRQLLKVRHGDRLEFLVDDKGQVLVKPGGADVTELRGLLHKRGRRAATVEEMNTGIRRYQARPDRRRK